MDDDAIIDERGNFADQIDSKVFRLLVFAGGQIEPDGIPLEPFFQNGYARLARIGSRLVIEHLQHGRILVLIALVMHARQRQVGSPRGDARPDARA